MIRISDFTIYNNDCLDQMAFMESDSVDAIVTDPPYGLAFMGAGWDSFGGSTGNQTTAERKAEGRRYADENKGAPRYGNSHGKRVTRDEMVAFQEAMTPIMAEALRVAKPGAHMLCFGGTRTFHRMACAIEDAGWCIKDCCAWQHGSGMPHGQRVERLMQRKYPEEADDWTGWNTQLKPAWEPIIVAYKPFKGTVADNVIAYGTGAMNIDACRIPIADGDDVFAKNPHTKSKGKDVGIYGAFNATPENWSGEKGRFPANVLHDGSDEVLSIYPSTGRSSGGGMHTRGTDGHESTGVYGSFSNGVATERIGFGDSGSAARFFYCAKASKKDRGEFNDHVSVKPNALMRWCVRLICRPGGGSHGPVHGQRLHRGRVYAGGHGLYRHRAGRALLRDSREADFRRGPRGLREEPADDLVRVGDIWDA